MALFLDTCIFLHYSNKELSQNLGEKAETVIKNEEWYTSSINVKELSGILSRRKKLYSNIYSIDIIQRFSGKTFREVYKQCFMSVLGDNRNDLQHITDIYNYVKRQTNLKDDSKLTNEEIESIQGALYPLLTKMKVRLGTLSSRFNKDATYYQKHVVPKTWDNAGRRLKKQIWKKIRIRDDMKDDTKMIIDATLFSDVNGIPLVLLTTDSEILKYSQPIQDIIKSIYPRCSIQICKFNEF